jgi:hypothetical protein
MSMGSAGKIGHFPQVGQTEMFLVRFTAELARGFPVAAVQNHFLTINSELRVT